MGRRQRCCEDEQCRRENHRRACAAWRKRHGELEREGRIRDRLTPHAAKQPDRPTRNDPLREIDWTEASLLTGLTTAVLVQRALEVALAWLRDEIRRQHTESTTESGGVRRDGSRDEIRSQPRELLEESGGVRRDGSRDETDARARAP